MTSIDKLIEGIDNKNISVVAEAFPTAIKSHVLRLIEAASADAFTKAVEKIEADSEEDKDDKESKDTK